MTVCSKCGAQNPPSNEFCARCEMPLPHSGVGKTLGAGAGARPGRALSQQGTLFGIAPEQMRTGLPARAAAPAREAPGGGRSATEPHLAAAHPAESRAARVASPGAAVPAEPPPAQRTLLGVMPDEVARALNAARPGGAAPARSAHADAAALPARSPHARPEPEPSPRGAFDVARSGGTVVGTAASPAAMPAAPAARELPTHTAHAPPDPGTVRSISPDMARAPTERFEAPEAEPEPSPLPAGPAHARTQLGVAIPGIAPLRTGGAGAPAAARAATRLEATRLEPGALLPSTPPPRRAAVPKGALVLLGAGLVLLLAAAAFALLWTAQKPLSVAIGADASGKDRIDVVCPECADGTRITLDGASAEFSGQKAYLTLPEPLPLGESRVSFGLERPGERAERVELTLPPVDYRIRPETSSLAGDQPRLTLKIEAVPGSTVEIAQQPVALDPAGHGEIAVDLTGQLIGPENEVVTFEQAIAYVITPPSGKVYDGELTVKVGVTPLRLEAPGADSVTDLGRFMLAGRTLKGAELWVAGTTLAVDANGRFAQLMSIDSVGETRVTVRATAPGLAPRFVSFRLERVQSLEGEAASRRQKALPLSQVARSIADHVGSTVVASGRVEEVRVDGHRTLILLQAEGECPAGACLARLVYGGLRKLARGESITAIGRLQGAVGSRGAAGPNAEVPEVDVALLL